MLLEFQERMIMARRIRREKLREHQYREGYEWDRDNNVDHMWEQVKRAMMESARKVCDSVRVGGKNPKIVWWNDEIKAAITRKEAA